VGGWRVIGLGISVFSIVTVSPAGCLPYSFDLLVPCNEISARDPRVLQAVRIILLESWIVSLRMEYLVLALFLHHR
jgi:hypothetical protein